MSSSVEVTSAGRRPPLAEAYAARVARGGLARDPDQAAAVERLAAIQEALAAPRGARGLLRRRRSEPRARGAYLWGGVGRGKSMLMDLFVEGLETPAKRRVHFHAFMQAVHRALHGARGEGAEDPVAVAADRVTEGLEVLALDEMEITDIVDATIVGRIFERILEAGTAVIVTSNRAPGDLYQDGLKRDLFLPFVRLLEERLEVLHLRGDADHRRRAPLAQGAFLTPADARAAAAMDALWEALSEGRHESLTLGRGVAIATDGRDAARASFAELCEAPLGAADYLRLAKRVSVLLLDDVPRLSERRHDEARRFITLIDVLYDARIGLVASADAAPERLYTAGEGAFEFARTASRLREMQSPDWPGRAALDARLAGDA